MGPPASRWSGRRKDCFTMRWGSAPVGQRILAQDLVIWGEGWYVGEDEKTMNYFIQVWVLRWLGFLSKALRLSKELHIRRTSPSKKWRRLGIHVIFHPCTMFSPIRTLVALEGDVAASEGGISGKGYRPPPQPPPDKSVCSRPIKF